MAFQREEHLAAGALDSAIGVETSPLAACPSSPASARGAAGRTGSGRSPGAWRLGDARRAASGCPPLECLRRETRLVREGLAQSQATAIGPEEAYREEREASEARFARLAARSGAEGKAPRPLSVALSGGGVRAAAFQCGVLWRVAACGRLKDVEHLSLVSGGAYVGTALVTFLLSGCADPHLLPEQDQIAAARDDLDQWYLAVMWQLIQRMQSNAGFLVRFSRHAFTRKGARPPVPGLLVFASVLVVAFVVLPVLNFVLVTTPLALLLDTLVGPIVRLAWCSDMGRLIEWSSHQGYAILAVLLSAAVFQMVMATLRRVARGLVKTHRRLALLAAFRNVALRAGVFMAALLFFAWGSLGLQWLDNEGKATCPRVGALAEGPQRCVDALDGHMWYDEMRGATTEVVAAGVEQQSSWLMSLWPIWVSFNALVFGLGVLGSCLRWRFLLIRGRHIAALLSPMWAAFAAALVVRWRIFGPLASLRFDEQWRSMMLTVLGLAIAVLPLYGKVRQVVHIYYRRSLRRAFYCEGADVRLSEAQHVDVCPNIIVAATLVDYCRTFDFEERHFSEFFFTPRRMGGERTGFIEVPKDMSLSRVMAISGAAADAFLLTKMNSLWVRVTLLALFNLFMGDYIEFRSHKQEAKWRGRLQAFAANAVLIMFFVLLAISDSFTFKREGAEQGSACATYHALVWSACALLGALLIASFFAVFPCFRWTLSSTTIRHLHMAMMHYFTSDTPPLRLFLNDGGLVECLGLISLLRRSCEVMLVTDATADFSTQLVCLRQTMQLAEAERLCTFFDPEDPRRGAEPALQAFAASQSTYLRLGVLYDCWGQHGGGGGEASPGSRRTGDIYFIRMRLLDTGRCVEHDRITEAEVMRPRATGGKAAGGPQAQLRRGSSCNLLREDIGGCCCDCCHTRCNCGLVGRFPDISTGNQFLTPTQFALLCRLGYEISGEAIDAMSVAQGPQGDGTGPHGSRR